jgi:hypothetical protein
MNLREHIPSYLNITNNKVLLCYEGKPSTCYACNSTTHQFLEFPVRRNRVQRPKTTAPPTFSAVVQQLHTTCNILEGTSGHNNELSNGTTAEDNENNIEVHGKQATRGRKPTYIKTTSARGEKRCNNLERR